MAGFNNAREGERGEACRELQDYQRDRIEALTSALAVARARIVGLEALVGCARE